MHLPFPRHVRTAHVRLDPRRCIACGDCVAACTRGALGLIQVARHRHVHVDDAERCRGCFRCVDACAQGVIQPLHPRPARKAGGSAA